MRSPDIPRISRSDIHTDSTVLTADITFAPLIPLTNALLDKEVASV